MIVAVPQPKNRKSVLCWIDDEDAAIFNGRKWHVAERGRKSYVARNVMVNGRHGVSYLHREIAKATRGTEVDHRNMNGLDNRKENLRLATKAQNAMNRPKLSNNTSGFKGVYRARKSGRFIADLWVHGVKHYLGSFASAEEAAKAYETAARKYHGDFART